MILVGVLALGGGGYFAYTNFLQDAPVEEATSEEGAPAEGDKALDELPEDVGIMYAINPFTVNLAGSSGKFFLKVTVSLELSAPEVNYGT